MEATIRWGQRRGTQILNSKKEEVMLNLAKEAVDAISSAENPKTGETKERCVQ